MNFNTMRVFILSLLLCCSARADILPTDYPKVFNSHADMHGWAMSTWTGTLETELTYQKYKLVVYIRTYTSGQPTSEPFVFMERDGKWYRILTAMTCPCEMEVAIEGDNLIFWRLAWLKGEREKIDYMMFNLKNLPFLHLGQELR